jgi:hypothetical protein
MVTVVYGKRAEVRRIGASQETGRKNLATRLEAKRGQPDLLEIVRTGVPPGRLASGLHRRQKQSDQRANDRDDDQ